MSCSVAATCHCSSIRLCSRLRPDRMCPSALNDHYAGVMCYHVTHNYIWLATPGWFQSFCRKFFLFCLPCQSALEPNPLTEEDFAGFYNCIELYGVHNMEISRVILEKLCLFQSKRKSSHTCTANVKARFRLWKKVTEIKQTQSGPGASCTRGFYFSCKLKLNKKRLFDSLKDGWMAVVSSVSSL